MWWFKASALAAVMALGLAGCGFKPLYGKRHGGEQTVSALSLVRIETIPDRLGQQVRNALLERLTPNGEPARPDYVLKVDVREEQSGMAYQRDTTTTLGTMKFSYTFQLNQFGDGTRVYASSGSRVIGFNQLGPRYASVAMERDTEAQGVVAIADDIQSQLAAFLGGHHKPRQSGEVR